MTHAVTSDQDSDEGKKNIYVCNFQQLFKYA